jgi:hypothetical protein
MNASDVSTSGNVLNLCIQWTMDCVQVGHAISCVWQSGMHLQNSGGYGGSAAAIAMQIPANVTGLCGQLTSPQSLDVGLAIDIQDANGNSLPLNIPTGSGVPVLPPVYPVLVP